MRPVVINTTYTITIFNERADRILSDEYSALSERRVVNDPAPANIGKTSGT